VSFFGFIQTIIFHWSSLTFFQKAFFCSGLIILTSMGISMLRDIFKEAMGKVDA